jgi:hypothetical protein
MSYRSINATTLTLTELLTSQFTADPLLGTRFGGGGNMEVYARTPEEMAELDNTGLSVWLYRIARDPDSLNMPPRRISADTFEYRPLPLRLHYLMTPVVNRNNDDGNSPGIEQLIIGKVLQVFHDTPLVKGALLRGDLIDSDATLGIRLEPLGLEEITRVWDALESSYQLCVSYEVSMVMLASNKEAERIVPVQSVQPGYGVISEGVV